MNGAQLQSCHKVTCPNNGLALMGLRCTFTGDAAGNLPLALVPAAPDGGDEPVQEAHHVLRRTQHRGVLKMPSVRHTQAGAHRSTSAFDHVIIRNPKSLPLCCWRSPEGTCGICSGIYTVKPPPRTRRRGQAFLPTLQPLLHICVCIRHLQS